MGKAWMAEGHDTFVEHLYLPGWELRRKKRAEESSKDADTSKRVRESYPASEPSLASQHFFQKLPIRDSNPDSVIIN